VCDTVGRGGWKEIHPSITGQYLLYLGKGYRAQNQTLLGKRDQITFSRFLVL